MSSPVPRDPARFFTEFFPAQFAASARFPRTPTAGSAAFEVAGEGAWSVRVVDRQLHVEPGVASDCALRLTTSPGDFAGLFVDRAERAMAAEGQISPDLRHALLPLFVDERKAAIVRGGRGGLALLLKEHSAQFRLTIHPGATPDPPERASVRLALQDFLDLTAGRRRVSVLLAMRRISVRGDLGYALHLSGLLG